VKLAATILVMGFATIVFLSSVRAEGLDLNLNSRLDVIDAKAGSLLRPYLKTQLNYRRQTVGIFLEAYIDEDLNDNFDQIRRDERAPVLQEAYLDLSFQENLYLKIGRQSARWSESWLVPSLDIWTGRRWNRAFIDPLPDQLIHSDAISTTIVHGDLQVDLMYSWNGADSIYPAPFSKYIGTRRSGEGGMRLKYSISPLVLTFVAAQLEEQDLLMGGAASYAAENWVYKWEGGHGSENLWFQSLGADGFFGDFTITPQVMTFELEDPTRPEREIDVAIYLSATYTFANWTFEAQGFRSQPSKDIFVSSTVGYSLNDWLKVSAFVQDYSSLYVNRLFSIYEEAYGTVLGTRIEGTFVF